MKKLFYLLFFTVALSLSACDLQPKIASIPDTVGEFISTRYPALLADPSTQPEIYNSAATDYGVYASPELYGNADVDDYILYSSVDDYRLKPQQTSSSTSYFQKRAPTISDDYIKVPMYKTIEPESSMEITVSKGDTVYSLSRDHSLSVDEFAKLNNLSAPYKLSIGQKLTVLEKSDIKIAPISIPAVNKTEQVKITKVELTEIKVGPGDTLYSISRKYSLPVNDLAVMNKLSAPFILSVGQKLKVPKLKETIIASDSKSRSSFLVPKTISSSPVSSPVAKTKISSDPTKALPAIASRSSSKFSWPVKGTILSSFGAKSNGLFNDGVNIGAKIGTKVGSAENGVVAYAGNELKGMGNLVIVQHSGGWMTVYAHMDKLSVRRGVKVKVGQQVGTIGQTGKVDKPQLHFEIRKGTKAYDPRKYLKR
ncbi:MAG: LysM peptidoglycan-binding domain-containing M23 family metallopeptidase [Alphaproteobacteria bacterium]|nr:LysM peptidoglycan-binding domain-containing M23 family metallopeptidase [Alphaproteobacteria bacterium]MBN2675547.1 LysM peptidoglycan-binding domain-containing M23 family metallopeptidase [Alphaproteobacteria bacterium]